jgi:hypothetical protein
MDPSNGGIHSDVAGGITYQGLLDPRISGTDAELLNLAIAASFNGNSG